jgi:hypothetical protein
VIVVILLLLSLFAMPDQKFPYFSGWWSWSNRRTPRRISRIG